jgi:predicted  nucleic acid-binding Zn-ribbon protein
LLIAYLDSHVNTRQLERLKREVSSRSQSSDAVLTLQKEVRAKTNELANLNAKITTLKRESSELRSRLEAIDAEKVAMVNEINQLKEWKRKAEVRSYCIMYI